MLKRNTIIAAVIALLLGIFGGVASADAKPRKKMDDKAIFTIIHAIPANFGADKVDIYANGQLIFDNATPGSSKTFSVIAGTQQISIYPDGVTPSVETSTVLSYRPMYLPKSANVSFVAHLNASNKPALSLFKNMNTEPGSKRSWLTVRHVAAAPTVDVRANSKLLFRSLSNTEERKISLPFGTYPVDVVLAGTTTVAIPSTNLVIKDNINYVVYAWGSANKSNLQFLVQEVVPRQD